MKKLITIFLFLVFSGVVWGQGFEDFTNSNATASYTTNSFAGNNSITWSYVASRDGNNDANSSGINLPALMLRRVSDGSKITSSTIANGIADFSVKLYKGFTGAGNRQVELFINGVSKGTSTAFDDFNEHVFSVNSINITGNVVIEIRNITSSQVIIDDITWTAFNGGAPEPEPTNHITAFSATANGHNQIDLTWNDNNGDQAAAGFLILANKTGTFSDPVDGTPQSDDTDMSDNEGKVNIVSGVEAASFTGLDAETQYFFKIFPYTNSGADIDYKTDGTVPTDDATTGVPPVSPQSGAVYISEVSDASAFNNEFLELYNNTSNTIDLTNTKIIRLTSAGADDGYVFDFSTDGTGDIKIPANGILVITRGNDKSSFESEWGALPSGVNYNAGNSLLYFGSGRQWALKDGGTANTNDGTLIDETGEAVASSGNRSYQNPIGTWTTNAITNATPGELDAGQVLPVELTSFSALAQSNTVNLTWETATEVNNYGFEIERTITNSKLQIPNWENVGFVEGHGNSNSAKQYTYVDNSVSSGQSYSYRLKQIDFDGQFEYSNVVNVEVGVPMELNLAQNYPNPFNPSTSIEYSVPSNEFVTLKVYDVLGNTVSTLVNETKEAGKYNVTFDASNLTSGIYFYSINAGGFTQVKKMMLVK